MGETPDYYAALGLHPAATAGQIKQAYRAAAKRAHPDAGGSAETMERVNEAYRILSHHLTRQEYDRLRAELGRAASAASTQYQGDSEAYAHHISSVTRAHEAQLHHRFRRAQARLSAWSLLKDSLVASIIAGIITRFLAFQSTDPGQKHLLALVGFIPVYGVLIALIFLLQPDLRLTLHDFTHNLTHRRRGRVHIDQSDLVALFALAASFIPLAILWIIFFASS
jgi:hypothetical protein